MNWIKSLKTGDKVLVFHSYCSSTNMAEAVVEKVTPSGLVKVDGKYYKPENGRARGKTGPWVSEWIENLNDPKTAEMYRDYKDRRFRGAVLGKLDGVRELTTEQAKAICGIMGWRYE